MKNEIITGNQNIIRKYNNTQDNINFYFKDSLPINFCAIILNSQISFNINIDEENTFANCFFFIPSKERQETSISIQTNFNAGNTKAQLHIISLANKDSNITSKGNIHIKKGIKNIETRLYEETLIIGNAKYISLIPGLKVESPDVIATHGAKIQHISPEKLFYMESRGLDETKSKNMIINSYTEYIINELQLNELEKLKFYSMIK